MAANVSFPIGCTLKGINFSESEDLIGKSLYLDEVNLIFNETEKALILRPIYDTDEIEVSQQVRPGLKMSPTQEWFEDLVGKKLQTIWNCHNSQGYEDQIIFAFKFLRPSIAFVSEASSLVVFRYNQI